MPTKKDFLLSTTVIAGVAALSLAVAPEAWAQTPDPQRPTTTSPTTNTTPPATPQPGETPDEADAEEQEEAEPDAEAQDEAGTVDAVVVTGSRIRRSEFTSPAPITVITSEQAELEGTTNTAEILQSASVAAVATQINNNYTGFVVTGGGGVNTLSLRGLGAQRTLFLINGRRAGPAGAGNTVGPFDLNVLPSSVMERFEILKDGASSIYGSDAIAGVVTFITRRNTDGLELNFNYNHPLAGEGQSYRMGAVWGRTFDRGYITLAADHFSDKGLRYRDREYLRCPQDFAYDVNTGERLDFIDPRTGEFQCINSVANIVVVSATGARFTPDPNAGPDPYGSFAGYQRVNLSPAQIVAAGNAATNPLFGRPTSDPAVQAETRRLQGLQPVYSEHQATAHAISPVDRYTLFASGGFDITPGIEIFGELLLNRRESEQDNTRQLAPIVAANNQFNPFGVQVQPVFTGPAKRGQEVSYMRGVAGLRGELFAALPLIGGWDWELYAQRSKSDADYFTDFAYTDRINAVARGVGCNPALITLSGPVTDCPAVNFFTTAVLRDAQLPPEHAAFLFGRDFGHTEYTHQYVEGYTTGELFNLPGGPIGVVLGFQVREEELNDQPGPQSQLGNTASASSGPTVGQDKVREFFGELELPLLKGLRGFESLTVNLSGRSSDYDSYGRNDTYKVGVNWQISPQFRIRGSKGTSFRAPTLFELFQAPTSSFLAQSQIDPCYQYGQDPSTTNNIVANCNAIGITNPNSTHGGAGSATIFTKGGVGVLEAETGESQAIGVVWTPTFIDLSVAVDLSEITINDQVQRFGSANSLFECFNSAPGQEFQNSIFCSLVTRNLTPGSPTFGAILTVNDPYLNVAEQFNRAIDLTVRYGHEFPWARMTINGQFTWQLDWTTQLLNEDIPSNNNNFVGFPGFAGNVGTRFDRGDWTLSWVMNMISKTSDVDNTADGLGTDVTASYRATGIPAIRKWHNEAQIIHDFSLRRKFGDAALTVGIQNAFNEEPAIYSSGGGTRFTNMRLSSQPDIRGRRVWLTASKSF